MPKKAVSGGQVAMRLWQLSLILLTIFVITELVVVQTAEGQAAPVDYIATRRLENPYPSAVLTLHASASSYIYVHYYYWYSACTRTSLARVGWRAWY